MLRVVDIQTVSIVVASASVVAGVIYYAFQLRHQTKIRQTDLIIRLYSFTASREFLEAWETIRDREIKTAEDYRKKYGGLVEVNQVLQVFEELGMLLQRKLIDAALVDEIVGRSNVLAIHAKLEQFLEDGRRSSPSVGYDSFEYLCNEMKRREQKLQQVGVRDG